MSALWPHWLRLGWLLLLPLLIWLAWKLWHRPQRSGHWQALIPPAFHSALLIGGEQRRTRLPWMALSLGWLLALLAACLAVAVGLRGGDLPPLPGSAGSGPGNTPTGPGR
jgi:hypothetical protein